jgi:hypothetical protein
MRYRESCWSKQSLRGRCEAPRVELRTRLRQTLDLGRGFCRLCGFTPRYENVALSSGSSHRQCQWHDLLLEIADQLGVAHRNGKQIGGDLAGVGGVIGG